MKWVEVDKNDPKALALFADVLRQGLPACADSMGRSMERYLRKVCRLYMLEGGPCEGVLALKYANGVDHWMISFLAFDSDQHEIIGRETAKFLLKFCEDQGEDEFVVLRPKGLGKMDAFFDKTSQFWDLDITSDSPSYSEWTLKKDKVRHEKIG